MRARSLTFLLIAAGLTLGACDDQKWNELFDGKVKLKGERKPVFPEGVPGITPGVPKELVRGSAESRAAADSQTAAAPPAAAAPPPSVKRTKTAAKRTPPPPAVEIAPDDVNVEDDPTPPPAQPQRPQRASQPQASPFPAPPSR